MGLAEKRALQEFRHNQWPQIQATFDEVLQPGQLEVVWEVLSPEDSGAYLADTLTEGLSGLASALKQVGSDELGREAIREAFSAIRVGNREGGDITSASNYALEQGVLHVKFNPRYQSGLSQEGVVREVKGILETFL